MRLVTLNKAVDQLNLIDKLAYNKGFAVIEKSVDAPSAFRVGNTLSAEQYLEFMNRIGDQSNFLKTIKRIDTNRTTIDLNALSIESRKTKRPTAGAAWNTSTNATIDNVGSKLTLLRNQLVYILEYDVLQDNADNPNFENAVNDLVAKQAANDLADLAINGTDDDYTASAFLELNKGFLTLFAADSNVRDVTYASYATKDDLFAAMFDALAERDKSRTDLKFFVNWTDHEAYRNLKQSAITTGDANKERTALVYNGIPIVPVDFMPDSKAFLAPDQNLVYAMGKNDNVSIQAIDDPEGVCFRLLVNYMADFGYFDGDKVVYAS